MSRDDKQFPNILFVSSNAFSSRNANGRVMEQLAHSIPDSNLSMIYFSGPNPDVKTGCRYLKLSDREKMKSFFKAKNIGQFITFDESSITRPTFSKKASGTHSALSLLLREFIWKHGKWDRTNVADLIIQAKPDIIVLNASRNVFVIDLAIYLKEQYDLPIVVYTTEDEYFHRPSFFSFLSRIFYAKVRSAYRRLYRCADETIVFHSGLKSLYDKEFKIDSKVIMMSTKIDAETNPQDVHLFTYAGNIDRGRDMTIIEIARALKEISSENKLRVISPNFKLAKKSFRNIDNIMLSGPLSYSEFQKAIHSSPIAFNIESFRKRDKMLIGATFSCKTADLLGGLSPLLVVGPEYTYVIRYFIAHPECAAVVKDIRELKSALVNLLNNKVESARYVQNAHSLIEADFNLDKNANKFLMVIKGTLEKRNKI
ncbi:MAG: hypothetical protein WC366_04085 [Bacilli bacterium]|jgi:hypothetical protein